MHPAVKGRLTVLALCSPGPGPGRSHGKRNMDDAKDNVWCSGVQEEAPHIYTGSGPLRLAKASLGKRKTVASVAGQAVHTVIKPPLALSMVSSQKIFL